MASIETRLYEWAATIYDRELDDEDKDNLYDELVRAADEIKELANENKELRDERDVDHYANIALYSALEEERKKHKANENKCGNCYFFIPNVGLINRNEHTKDGTCGRHAYEKVFCGKEDFCSWWLAIPPKGEEE